MEVAIKRDDLLHPEVMGNKWRKLKYNLQAARDQGCDTLVTYGGAFSNHIAAVAAAGKLFSFKTVGIIRGDELRTDSNPTLSKAAKDGMTFFFVARDQYRTLKEKLEVPFRPEKRMYILPEGGTNELAVKGCEEILRETPSGDFDLLCTAMGTGATFCGLGRSALPHQKLIGFSALKGNWIQKETQKLLDHYDVRNLNYLVYEDRFFGGYGKYKKDLIQFILDFRQYFGILLDPIYTGKMIFSVWDMIENDQIAKGTRILLLHTGGLQGITGFNFRNNLALPTL